MTPEQVREIIREELKELIGSHSYTFQKHIQILNARNVQLGKGTGTKIGTEATQKLAFFGATPIVRVSAISAPSGGATIDSDCRRAVNDIRTALTNLGLTS